MDNKHQYEVIEDILWAAGIRSREDLKRFDKKGGKHGGVAGLKGIGPRRRKLIERALLEPGLWAVVFRRLTWRLAQEDTGDADSHVGARVVTDVPMIWQPSEMLTEGHSLTPPDSEGAGKGPSYDPD